MKSVTYRRDEVCRVCGGSAIDIVWSLTPTPLGDHFRRTIEVQDIVPLDLAICGCCGYLHLPVIVNPADSYTDYLYQSSVTVGLRQHYLKYAESIFKRYSLSPSMTVVDIGSNDGSMLAAFKNAGLRVVGVEPASSPARAAEVSGLETINSYFDEEARNKILRHFGKPKVVTTNYVFANIDNLGEFLRLVESMLAKDSVFVIETGYHPVQFENCMFDYVYHEHFSYFSVEVLEQLLNRYGLELIHVSVSAMKGGALRAEAQIRGGDHFRDRSVDAMIAEESRLGINSQSYYTEFRDRIWQKRDALCEVLDNEVAQGNTIVGFGASHSTTTLIYEFGLGKYLAYLIDDNVHKHGTFSPGLGLPVLAAPAAPTKGKNTVVVLAWQHQESILRRHKSLLSDCANVIVPLPNLRLRAGG